MSKTNKNSSDNTKILGWEISPLQKQKLIRWTIEGVIIGIVTFVVLWLPLVNQ